MGHLTHQPIFHPSGSLFLPPFAHWSGEDWGSWSRHTDRHWLFICSVFSMCEVPREQLGASGGIGALKMSETDPYRSLLRSILIFEHFIKPHLYGHNTNPPSSTANFCIYWMNSGWKLRLSSDEILPWIQAYMHFTFQYIHLTDLV